MKMNDSQPLPDDAFDSALRKAMTQRPVEGGGNALLQEIMNRVELRRQREAQLARVGQWMKLAGVAAGLLVVAMIAAIALFGGLHLGADQASLATTVAADAVTSDTRLFSTEAALCLLAAAVVGVSVFRLFAEDSRCMQLGAEA